jgi:hypothetical protein
MLARLHAQFHEIRLDLQGRHLRSRERLRLRRLGEGLARMGAGRSEAFGQLLGEIADGAAGLRRSRRSAGCRWRRIAPTWAQWQHG